MQLAVACAAPAESDVGKAGALVILVGGLQT